MRGNLRGFNAAEHNPLDSLEPVPAGWYTVMITDSEMRPTKSGDGEYLQLALQVVEGEFQGRRIWDRLNLNNSNQTAVDIAQRALASICRAVGVLTPSDSTELHDRPFEIKVTVRPPKDGYDASNEIKGYREAGGGAPARQTAGRAPAMAGGASSTPPWKR